MANDDKAVCFAILAYALLDRECPTPRPTSLTPEMIGEVMGFFCHLDSPQPTDRWDWLDMWAKGQSEAVHEHVRRLRRCDDDDLAFNAALVGSIIKVSGKLPNGKHENRIGQYTIRFNCQLMIRTSQSELIFGFRPICKGSEATK